MADMYFFRRLYASIGRRRALIPVKRRPHPEPIVEAMTRRWRAGP